MYQRALAGHEKALGLDHISTLRTVHNKGQGKLEEAQDMYHRALAGREKELVPITYPPSLQSTTLGISTGIRVS
jgi:Tetratricopeptide repeat